MNTSETKMMKEMEIKLAAMEEKIANMPKARDRGPESTRKMTSEDAKRICHGDLKDTPHMECAVKLGLSYGQVYSNRGGYTFKREYKGSKWEAKELAKYS